LTIGEGVAQRLRDRVFSALMRQPSSWYDAMSAESLTTVIGADVEVIQAAVVRLLGARVRR
jgi:ABC-type multidrug transport system fused ATPase/permease subunit